MSLKTDLDWCEAIIRIHSGSFYRAFKQLPREKASAVFAVYAFCRIADDSIDVDHDEAELELLEQQLEEFAQGITPNEPLWRSLRWAFDTFNLEIGPFRDMLRGQRQDLNFKQPESRENLLEYCYLVAGTVGLMILPLLSNAITPKTRQVSIELGQAMQLTNILRDVGADYRNGRIYLPVSELTARGIMSVDFGHLEPTLSLQRYWLDWADETLKRYSDLRENLQLFDPDARLPVSLAMMYYSHITLLGVKQPTRILSTRIVVSNGAKLRLLMVAKFLVWRMNTRYGG